MEATLFCTSGDPFQSSTVAGIEPHPLRYVAIDPDANAERIVSANERNRLPAARGKFFAAEEADFLRTEINLDHTIAEEIHTEQSVDVGSTSSADRTQIQSKDFARNGHGGDDCREAIDAVGSATTLHALNGFASPELYSQTPRGGEVQDTFTSTGIEQKTERSRSTCDIEFQPNHSGPEGERNLGCRTGRRSDGDE